MSKLGETGPALALPLDTKVFRSRKEKNPRVSFHKIFFIILIKITIPNSASGGKTDIPMRGGDGIEALLGTQRSLYAYRGELS